MPRGRFGDFLDLLEQAQFLEAGHVGLDVAHRQAPLAALLEEIGAEPADAGHEIGEIHLALLFQPLAQMRGRDLLDHLVHPFLGRERAFDGDELAVDAENDRRADLEVNVRRAAFDGGLQNPMKHFHGMEGSRVRSVRKTKMGFMFI